MFSATDVANFLACHHIVSLELAESRNEIKKPFFPDPALDLLQKLGLQHEQSYLQRLRQQGQLSVVEIDFRKPWTDTVVQTLEAIRDGADVIYQATFLRNPWRGRSDFLIRVDRPSRLGNWSYEVLETKLARSTKAGALVQLCFYSDLLTEIQGIEPRSMHVSLGGSSEPESFPVRHYIAYFRHIRKELEQYWDENRQTYPEPTEHCDVCSWFTVCDNRWRADDYLCLVAGISRNQRKVLSERSIDTVAKLAEVNLPLDPKVARIGEATLVRIHEQANIQVRGRQQGHVCYELLQPLESDRGLCALPQPSANDVFLDFEADPYVLDGGLEYLMGWAVQAPSQSDPTYEALWSFNRAEEQKAFETLISIIMARWQQDPAMHVYHYAPYEPSAIKRLAGRHGTCVDEVDELLRAGVFVDLYRIVRQGLRASVESYSIKRLEPLYDFRRYVPLRDANLALSRFEAALAIGANQDELAPLLHTILGYNKDDCVSTLLLRSWLEEKRQELAETSKSDIPRPAVKSGEPGLALAAQLDEAAELKKRLLELVPDDEAAWNPEQRAIWLLAHLLEWHRREEKSAWWEYFRLCELSSEELQEDRCALGGLEYIGEVDRTKRSIIHRYSFPPQEHTINRALDVRDPKTGKGVGEVAAIDDFARTIDLKRGTSAKAPHPKALVPFDIVNSDVLRNSLLRLGRAVTDHGITGPGALQAARDLLLRQRPQFLTNVNGPLIGSDDRLSQRGQDLVNRLAEEPCVLPIQGPPGTGKTFTGARMVVELVKLGRRVGITAVSHKVISNFMRAVGMAASELGIRVSGVQKCNDDDGCDSPFVIPVETNDAILEALTKGTADVAGGTAWLWSREEMTDSVDVLFVDEAGQMSLANVLSLAQAARSVVLLGDPQQLEQPQRGIHPEGAEVSALGHLLGGRATIPADRGIFLEETRRLHPDICSFTSELFYDGRLHARPENSKQRLHAAGTLNGAGLRFISVDHTGNQNESPEEVERIAELVSQLLQTEATWTNSEGVTSALTLNDILIVAPYNAQVYALVKRLPNGARIGTVDKFQGQQAPLVIYSMTTSTQEDAPRGMEFLYSINRLNVAVSRARCVAAIIASPLLFRVQCKTPRQIELANAFCRYLEMADFAPPIALGATTQQ